MVPLFALLHLRSSSAWSETPEWLRPTLPLSHQSPTERSKKIEHNSPKPHGVKHPGGLPKDNTVFFVPMLLLSLWFSSVSPFFFRPNRPSIQLIILYGSPTRRAVINPPKLLEDLISSFHVSSTLLFRNPPKLGVLPILVFGYQSLRPRHTAPVILPQLPHEVVWLRLGRFRKPVLLPCFRRVLPLLAVDRFCLVANRGDPFLKEWYNHRSFPKGTMSMHGNAWCRRLYTYMPI